MSDQSQSNSPRKVNTDKAKKFLSQDEASFILNGDTLNPAAIGKSTPLPANSPLCEIEQPVGENFSPHAYYSPLTNEAYSWAYNTNGANYLKRVNGNGECEIVYDENCLPLSAAPEHTITQWRADMHLEKICHNRHGKELIWVDGTDNDIFCLDVEASIATNSFTTPFFDRCPDPCAPLKLCVPDICGCIKGEFAPLETAQQNLTNHLKDVGVKIIVRHIYYDLRASEWSTPSTLFYQDIKGGCFGGAEGFSRCLKLTIPLGNPLVDKIEIGYSLDNGANWLLSDTVEKYASYTSANQYWYEREINPELALTEDGCSFFYFFCNDKQCQAIDPKEVARVYNPAPRSPQGFFRVKDAFAFYNYLQGNCPLDKIEVDKFKITSDCVNDADCVTDYVTVKVRAIIHNNRDNTNEFVYRENGTYSRYGLGGDDENDPAWFGAFERITGFPYYKSFEQKFADKKRNFNVYVEGSNYSSRMFQYRAYEGFTQNKYIDIVSGFATEGVRNDLMAIISSGFYYYQQAELKVPKGTKGFLRLSSHASATGNHDTSTFVIGTINNIVEYKSTDTLPALNNVFEIYFDTCNGDVDLSETFIIEDNAEESDSKAANGLVIDNLGAPIAGVDLYTAGDDYLGRTDHNGFYHFTIPDGGDSVGVKVIMEQDCSTFGSVQPDTINLVAGKNVVKDIRVTNPDYATKWYAWANVRVVDCDGNNVAGVPVAVSGAKSRFTDDSGTALIPIRNYPNRTRQVRAIAMDAGGCFLLGCDGNCNPCASSQVLTAPACFDVVHFQPRSIDFEPIVLNIAQKSLNNRGLKKGGRYPFGIVAKGGCGRISSVYNVGYINIPRFQENSSEDFCNFKWDARNIKLPDWVKCLEIVRGANLNPFELQWVIDKIERTGDGKIILTIQSLNDYNEKYSFKTNTIYQYQQGDRIEFVSNGDGKVFTTAEHGVLNFATLSPFNDQELSGNTDADFFNQLIFQDDGKLNDLVVGAKIELQRNKECTTEPAYFSICTTLQVVDGEVVEQTGKFETFDTFRVTRTIGNFSPQSFEHFAPSDFWLTRADDTGKPYFVNKYENERRYGRNFSLNSPTQINRFGDTVKTVGAQEQGDIIAAFILDGKVVVGVCENDNFLLQVADDLVRVSADGTIVAVPADRIIGDPEIKLGGVYGCRYQDIGSVFFGESYVLWVDIKRDAYVKHGYGMNRDASKGPAVDISENKFKNYLKTKFRQLQVVNQSAQSDLDKVRFVTGINKFNNTVALTIKSLHDGNINNEQAELLRQNETLIIEPFAGELLTFASFTPEAYSVLNLPDEEGCAFLSYSQAVPFLHPINATVWNRFYGIAVDRVFTIAINKYPEKEKVAIAVEIQDEMMWYVSKVVTDKVGYESEIPPVRVGKFEDKWNASFLGNKNSRRGLYGREQPRGFYVLCTFVRDNKTDNIYNSVNNAKRIIFDECDEIITKFLISEQSGMSENL